MTQRATHVGTGEGQAAPPPSNPPASRRSPKEHRTAIAHARLTPAELAEWRGKAAAAGCSLSDLIRQAMRRTRTWTAPARDEVRSRTVELARIGANVNQIARWCNTHKEGAAAVEVLLYLAAIERELVSLRRLEHPED